MHVLTVANQKGGVGKSTLVVHLAWHALETGRPVVLIDLDGQANSTRTFAPGGAEDGTLRASDLFTGEPTPGIPALQAAGALRLIGADLAVNDVEREPLSSIHRPAAWLADLAAVLDPATLVLIDTPPTLGRRLLSALIASNAVVSPLALNGYSLQGITDLQRTINTVRKKFNPALRNLGLLPNMVNLRTATHRQMLARLTAALPDKLLPYHLANRIAIADATDRGRPCWHSTRGGSGLAAGREMRAVCSSILGSH